MALDTQDRFTCT